MTFIPSTALIGAGLLRGPGGLTRPQRARRGPLPSRALGGQIRSIDARDLERLIHSLKNAPYLVQIGDYQLNFRTIQGIFQNAYFDIAATFHKGKIEIPNAPDLKIEEGAWAYLGLRIQDGLISLGSDALELGGIKAWWWSVRGLYQDPSGHLKIDIRYFPDINITEKLLKTPLRTFFQDGRLQPISIPDLASKVQDLRSDKSSGPGDVEDLGLIREVALSAEFPALQGCRSHSKFNPEKCAPAVALLRLDLPRLLEYIRVQQLGSFLGRQLEDHQDVFKNEYFRDFVVRMVTIVREGQFDFSGILEGSYLNWPDFPLDALTLPGGIKIFQGARVDLSVHFDPQLKTTEIQFKNLDAKIEMPAVTGVPALHLKGDVIFRLHGGSGRKISVELKDLHFSVPTFPSEDKDIAFLEGTLSGDIAFNLDKKGLSVFEETRLQLSHLRLVTEPNRYIQWGDYAIATELVGSMDFTLRPHDAENFCEVNWDLSVGAEASSPTSFLTLHGASLRGKTSWHLQDGQLVPDLERLDLSLVGDFSDETKGISAQGLWLNLRSLSNTQSAGMPGNLRLELGADSASIGGTHFIPTIDLDIRVPSAEPHMAIEASGSWSVFSNSSPLELGSRLNFSYDPTSKKLTLHAQLRDDQTMGGIRLQGGEVDLELEGDLSKKTPQDIVRNFSIKTHAPLDVYYEDDLIVRRLKLIGGLRPNRTPFLSAYVPQIFGAIQAYLSVTRSWEGDIDAAYSLQGPSLPLSGPLALHDVSLQGRLQRPATSKALYLRQKAHVRMLGQVEGNFSTEHAASLRYKKNHGVSSLQVRMTPESSFVFNISRLLDSAVSLEGGAKLQGIFELALGGGVRVTGRQVGIQEGRLETSLAQWIEGSPQTKTTLLSDLRFVIDRLGAIKNGVIHSGGDGILFETQIHLLALGLSDDASRTRTLRMATDRLHFKAEAYLKDFHRFLHGLGVVKGEKAP